MNISKIEARREQLKAYEAVIEDVNRSIDLEFSVISSGYGRADDEQIERAKIRCAALHQIRNMIEQEVIK